MKQIIRQQVRFDRPYQRYQMRSLALRARDLERAILSRDEMIRDAITAGIPIRKVAHAAGLTRKTVATILDTDPLAKRIRLVKSTSGVKETWVGTLHELIALDGPRLTRNAHGRGLPVNQADAPDFARWALADWGYVADSVEAAWEAGPPTTGMRPAYLDLENAQITISDRITMCFTEELSEVIPDPRVILQIITNDDAIKASQNVKIDPAEDVDRDIFPRMLIQIGEKQWVGVLDADDDPEFYEDFPVEQSRAYRACLTLGLAPELAIKLATCKEARIRYNRGQIIGFTGKPRNTPRIAKQ